MKRSVESVQNLVDNYLKKYGIFQEEAPWEIKRSNLGGLGVFAKRDIQQGVEIFKDYPMILGPRAKIQWKMCAICYKKCENLCLKGCGLTICDNTECQNSNFHKKECKMIRQWQKMNFEESDCLKSKSDEISKKAIDKSSKLTSNAGNSSDKSKANSNLPTKPKVDLSLNLLQVLAPIRSLFLDEHDKELLKNLKAHQGEQHGFEVDFMKILDFDLKELDEIFMRLTCSVLDANAFEVIIGNEDTQSNLRGLYPLGGLANHCCIPNAYHVFDNDCRMIVRASRFIAKGEEVLHSYSRLIWGNLTRRYHLFRTKHFHCKCTRCLDPTESETYMGCILCRKCKGNVLPLNHLQTIQWKCETCGATVKQKDVGSLLSLLGSTLSSFDNSEKDLKFILKFLDKLRGLVPETSQVIVELKYKTIWTIGYSDHLKWGELQEEQLNVKEGFCRDLLDVLNRLKVGDCNIKALILYELYRTLKELEKLKISKPEKTDLKYYLSEAARILQDDVSAPDEIKNYILGNKLKN